ncbi:MAG: hypothetical protein ACNYPD_06750 [Candidatus Halichondribacter symbioticus]
MKNQGFGGLAGEKTVRIHKKNLKCGKMLENVGKIAKKSEKNE